MVDEQNKINIEKTLGYDRSYDEARDTMHPNPQLDVEPPVKSPKKDMAVPLEKEKDAPQPSHALQEFVKHIADPLVDKGWNLHLKFGKGEPQGEQFVQGSSPWEPTTKTDKKEKVSKPQISKQVPLEMGTGGGGGGGKKGGSGGKKPPEDKIEIEGYPSENEEDDSSSETSFELNVDPQQLASVGLNRPLLRLRLTPRRRVTTTAPGGGGMYHHQEEELKPCQYEKDKMTQGITNLLRVVEAHHNHQMVGVEELAHHSQKGVEGHLSDQWVEEELLLPGGNGGGNGNGDDNGGGDRPPPQGEMEEMAVMEVMMEMAVEEMIHHHCQIKGNHITVGIIETDGYMWYKDHPDSQVNWDKTEGMVGMDKCHNWWGMINALGVASTPLDTTGLENSFENLGRTMVDVLTIQQQTNLALKDQIRRANDTQMEQTLAMHDLADMTEQRTYDSMFVAVPIYHGNDNEDFDGWADQLEVLCEISQ